MPHEDPLAKPKEAFESLIEQLSSADSPVGIDAKYTHAVCLCGERIERSGLTSVAFDEGPIQLADLEVDWTRVGALAVGVALIGGFVGWYFLF